MKKKHIFIGIGVMALISACCVRYSKKVLADLVSGIDDYEHED